LHTQRELHGVEEVAMLAKLPKVFGIGEARNAMTQMMEEVGKGQTFIIKGTRNREALVMDADRFRRWQEAYMNLVGLVETQRIMEDGRAMSAMREVIDEGTADSYSLSEVEKMLGEDIDGEGQQP